jgi:hypothetical protein
MSSPEQPPSPENESPEEGKDPKSLESYEETVMLVDNTRNEGRLIYISIFNSIYCLVYFLCFTNRKLPELGHNILINFMQTITRLQWTMNV